MTCHFTGITGRWAMVGVSGGDGESFAGRQMGGWRALCWALAHRLSTLLIDRLWRVLGGVEGLLEALKAGPEMASWWGGNEAECGMDEALDDGLIVAAGSRGPAPRSTGSRFTRLCTRACRQLVESTDRVTPYPDRPGQIRGASFADVVGRLCV
jgi:hypothetical protein